MRARSLFGIGIVLLSQFLPGCSSPSGDSGTPIPIRGSYAADEKGSIQELNFQDDSHYFLWRSPCAQGKKPAPGANRCRESGSFKLNDARTELTLTDAETGQSTSMPFRALGDGSSLTKASMAPALSLQDLSSGNGAPLVQNAGSLISSFQAGDQKYNRGVYIALGDSYSSGVGTNDYVDNCKRSNYAYAKLIADSKGYDLKHVACSGNKTDAIAGQLGQVSADALSAATLVTMTVGGNDIGFADIGNKCVNPLKVNESCSDAIKGGSDKIRNELPGKLNAVYKDIKAKVPKATVIILGYPRAMRKGGVIATGACEGAGYMPPGDANDIRGMADLLDETIEKAASSPDFGFVYVDPRDTFEGHNVCDEDGWINGAVLSNTGESFHPTKRGYEAFRDLILPRL